MLLRVLGESDATDSVSESESDFSEVIMDSERPQLDSVLVDHRFYAQ